MDGGFCGEHYDDVAHAVARAMTLSFVWHGRYDVPCVALYHDIGAGNNAKCCLQGKMPIIPRKQAERRPGRDFYVYWETEISDPLFMLKLV